MLRDAMSGQDHIPSEGERAGLSTFEAIRDWLMQFVANRLGVATAAVAVGEHFQRLGLDSLGATGMLAELGRRLGRSLSPSLVWEFPSVAALAKHLAAAADSEVATLEGAAPAQSQSEPIAIVGMACRFPQAEDLQAYWALLRDGVDAVGEVPADRWDIDALYSPDPEAPGKIASRWGGFLRDVKVFDPAFFGISPREAIQIDPQQRLALELSWEALEDAGIPANRLRGGRCGVFVGVVWHDFADLLLCGDVPVEQHSGTGQGLSIVANRISYTLGLQGPSVALDTACSSSLVAIHLACQSLRAGESNLALVAGINLMLSPYTSELLSKFGALSPRGRCRAFDAGADGFVRGEGGGCVVLKPLSRALIDGDRIYCVIRGSAVNNDGASNGLTAPNPAAQRQVLREACGNAQVDPRAVDYVETHGTGTRLGDPIEAAALGAVLGAGRPAAAALRIGSVKTNIGHQEGASGIAGLIKTALAVHERQIPPSLHFVEPNPLIPFDDLRLQVVTSLQPWPGEKPALAGVSSFGWGGSNCHVILGGLDDLPQRLVRFAAADQDQLRQTVQAALAELTPTLANAIPSEPAAQRLSQLASRPPGEGLHRLALVTRSAADLARSLHKWLAGESIAPGAAAIAPAAARPVAWVFSPQGGQWRGMATQLFRQDPTFRATLAACDAAIARYGHFSLLQELHQPSPQFAMTSVVQPCLFAVQVALAAMLQAHGLHPTCIIGHSVGEVSAAYVCGALSLDDAARLVVNYSRLQATTAGDGGMALVQLSLAEAQALLSADEDTLCIAGENSPDSTILSGRPAALDAVMEKLRAQGRYAARIDVNIAAHSPQMDPLLEPLRAALRGLRPRPGRLPMWSTSARGWVPGESLDGTWVAQNLRGPVHFREGIEALQGQGIELFVEVNSHPIILRSIQQTLQATGSSAFACGTLQRDQAEQQAVLSTLAQLWLRGASLDAAPTVPRTTDEPEFEPAQLLVLSAQSEAALAAQRQRLLAYLRRPARPALADLAYSLATTRSPLRHRMALVVRSFNGLEGALAAAPEPAEGGPTAIGDTSTAKLAFLFTGQGAQIAGMGQGLHRAFPAFREAFERALHLFERGRPGFLRRVMWAPAGHADAALLDQTGYTQPALFVLEYALCMQWQAWGITPDLVAGHSIGELVAACIAGVFTLEDAARLCLARAELMQALPAGGAMASIACPEATVAAAVSAHASEVAIAGVNGPEQVVISGAQAAVLRIVEAFVARGVRTKMLRVSHAFHSPLMDPMLAAFAEVARSIRYHAPTRPLISNLSGRLAGAEICTPEYWVRHVREAVRFAEGLHSLDAAGVRSFVEIGPKSTLLGLVPTCLPQREVALLPSLRAERPEDESVLAALGDLFARGRQVDWDGVFSTRRRCFDLPSYPFQRQSYWPLQPGPATLRSSSGSNASLYRFEWLERPRSSALKAGPAGKAWLILTAASGLSRELAAALTKAGRRVVVLPTDVDLATLRANLAAPEISWEGVAYLAALDTSDGEAATAADVLAQLQRMLSPVLRVNQLLTAHGLSPRQWLLTRGAWAVSPGDRPAPLQAALWGLGRVLATENPASWGGLIDLDPQAEEDDVPALLNEFLSPTAEDQLALRHHRRWAVELRPLPKEAEPASVSVIAEATYVITGGLGGLGLAVAQWLVEKGARHLVLTSRHGLPSEGAAIPDLPDGQKEAAAVVAQLVARGVQVTAAAVDVADAEAMRGLLSSLQPRVRGVLHLAGVMSDALVAQQDVALLDPVLRSKAVGAWVLHQITRDLPLDFFVLFSSVAAVLGPPGKGSYAAANAVLDALAELRRAEGLPAVSLGFGPWTGGMAKRLRKEVFAELGTRQLTDEDALSLLGRQLRGTEAQLMVAAMDWGRFAASLPPGGRQRQLTRAFLPVEPAAANPGASTAPISRADRLQSLSATVRRCVANVLGISDAAAVGGSQIFGELGLDSLMAVKLQGALQRELGQPLSSTLAFDHPTVDRLTAHLRETLFPEEAEALAAGSPLAPSQDPIAVIGMAMRWPGDVSDPQAAWALMRAGTDVVRDVPPSRWKAADWVDPTPDSGALTTVTRGGFLSDIETFDAAFFRIAPLEVLTMDPQQRMLLEVSWEALERAGQDPLALRDSRTGVFVGAGANEYAERLQDMSDVAAARYSGTGNLSSVLAGRLSYFLGLQGPSL
ncbi:MAG TPA: beta-ketoacyl synthase N-terminal-like domain-containing protein, partial [Pseudomonadota bacterium]|nr:beta-ketoacyl synthase N-terminal-like domain-containing protein [Pseudomonadota bacterium]